MSIPRATRKRRPAAARAALALALTVLLHGAAPALARLGFPGDEGSAAPAAPGALDALPQWRRMLQRHAVERCTAEAGTSCARRGWGGLLAGLAQEPRPAQIKAVNFVVNQLPYREDSEAWGVADYWATPGEMLARGGDCEDFAIAKYFALRALGVPAEDLFVLVVRDEIGRASHAVLAVRLADEILILDNRSRRVLPWRELGHYRPIYWVNEAGGWFQLAGN